MTKNKIKAHLRIFNRASRTLSFVALLLLPTIFYSQASPKPISFKDSIASFSQLQLNQQQRKYFYTDSLKVEIINEKMLLDIRNSKYTDDEVCDAYTAIYFWKANVNDKRGCIAMAQKALEVAEKIDAKRRIALAINIIAFCHYSLGEYNLAIKNYTKALKVADGGGDEFMSIAIRSNLADVKIACNDLEGGINLIHEQIKKIESNKIEGTQQFLPQTYASLTNAYVLKENLEKARYYNTLGLESEKNSNDVLPVTSLALANIEISDGNYNKALDILSEIEKNRNKESFIEATVSILSYKGKALFLKKEYSNAIREFKKLEQLKNNYEFNSFQLQEVYRLLAQSYKALNQEDQSLDYFEKALSTFTENEKIRIELIGEIASKYDKVEFEKEIRDRELTASKKNYEQFSSLQKELSSLQRKKRQHEYFLIYGAIVAACLIIAFGIWLFQYRKSNRNKFEALLTQVHEKENRFMEKNKSLASKPKNGVEIRKETYEQIITGLQKLENKRYYLSKECTVVNMAKKLRTNSTYLSKAINDHFEVNFNTYIHSLRINYAIDRLKNDTQFRSYSIKAISAELGYQSANTFTKSFKERTGILPSYYIRKLNAQKVIG
ncbi:MAG: helix-turn-helix domain-containing protein [Bacteroidota bacterium]